MSLKNIFEAVAHEWHQPRADRRSLRYHDEIIDIFEKDIPPYIGKHPITEIKPMKLLEASCKTEKRGALGRMRKVRQRCGEVFRHVIVTGGTGYNPTPDLANALATPEKVHFPSPIANKFPHFLNDPAGYIGSIITKTATQIIMLTGVCTQGLRSARWGDVDFKTKLWEIPAEMMEMKQPHIVPLSGQAITLFKQLEPISKHHLLVFIDRNDPRKPTGKESVSRVIELLRYKGRLTEHGFRHTMSIILYEKGFNSAQIETQPAYIDKNVIRGTYNHVQYLDGRREMMQWYADYIGSLTRENIVHGDFKNAVQQSKILGTLPNELAKNLKIPEDLSQFDHLLQNQR